jgi:chaperone required for assembly of F1-ATPase
LSARKLKRFYDEVRVVPISDGFEIQLDGKPLRSPEKNALLLPNAFLGEAVAEEWRTQEKDISPPTMPFTKLAFTAADRVAPNREAVIEQISAFANSDVICYRASEPDDLVKRQKESWDSILDWADSALGAAMKTGEGIGYVAQDYNALCALTETFSEQSDFHLAGLYSLVSIANSLLLALAVAEEEIGVEDAFRCANCDELYQSEKWGVDAEAQARLDERAEEFRVAAKFLDLLRGAPL